MIFAGICLLAILRKILSVSMVRTSSWWLTPDKIRGRGRSINQRRSAPAHDVDYRHRRGGVWAEAGTVCDDRGRLPRAGEAGGPLPLGNFASRRAAFW